MKRSVAGVLAVGMMAALAACGAEREDGDPAGGGDEARMDVPLDETRYEDAVAATNALGLEMTLGQEPGENAIVSPASLTIALAMLAEGAVGDGDAELTELLGLGGTDRTEAYSALTRALGAYEAGEFSVDEIPEDPFLRVANNLVVLDGYEVKESFTDAVTGHFDATTDSADLASQSGKDVLDAWVREQTEGLIEESAIEPDVDLRLVLQNALLFAAQWAEPFAEAGTFPETFVRGDGTEIDVDMMHDALNVAFGEADGHTAIALPYNGDFIAYAVLPPEGEEPTTEGVNAAIEALGEPTLVDIALPAFDLAVETDVADQLMQRGITAIFNDDTSLHGIAEDDLVVSAIAQQARLIVDEDGTVGAAVTEIGVSATSMPIIEQEFRADRPFVFLVRHEPTGIDLFTAWINDPTAE